MTMDLSGNAFFCAYLRALNSRQLTALDDWQGERLLGDPSKEVITNSLSNKREIYLEQKRRKNDNPW